MLIRDGCGRRYTFGTSLSKNYFQMHDNGIMELQNSMIMEIMECYILGTNVKKLLPDQQCV